MYVFKKIVFCTLLWGVSFICSAQEISIRGGFILSKFGYENEDGKIHYEGNKLKTGYSFGTILELPLKGKFNLETGLLFTTKGRKITGANEYLLRDNMVYVDIPVLVKTYFSVKNASLFGIAGPYIGGGIYGNRYSEGTVDQDLKQVKVDIQWGNKPNEFDRLDYGIKLGIGTKINRYQIGALYNIGLNNFSNEDDLKLYHKIMEFYIAYKFLEL